MKLYLDCEFNDFKGALISMALVDENGREWYEVVQCENPSPWVAEHVMPILGRGPVSIPMMQASLSAWLSLYDSVHVVADWPEDIAHFCQALITGPGVRLNTPPLTMEVVRIDATSELPHNALADARGIRAALAEREPADRFGTDADLCEELMRRDDALSIRAAHRISALAAQSVAPLRADGSCGPIVDMTPISCSVAEKAVAVPEDMLRVIHDWEIGSIGSYEAMYGLSTLAPKEQK